MEEREIRVQELGNEVRELSQSIVLLLNQIREKENELRKIENKLSDKKKELEKKENELRICQSNVLRDLESKVGMYVKVHVVKADLEDEYWDEVEEEKEFYWVGLLGKLKHNAIKELVAPIENCISVNLNNSVFKVRDAEFTTEMIDNPLISFEFITKEEADKFIASHTPKL